MTDMTDMTRFPGFFLYETIHKKKGENRVMSVMSVMVGGWKCGC